MTEKDKDLTLTRVVPESADWQEFVTTSCDYILTQWPGTRLDQTNEFQRQYDRHLRDQLEQGGRGLFFLQTGWLKVGLANVYVEDDTLHIAEFYVMKAHRCQGFGRRMRNLVIDWGKEQRATQLLIEVDKDFVEANAFWLAFEDLELDDSSDRNIYHKSI